MMAEGSKLVKEKEKMKALLCIPSVLIYILFSFIFMCLCVYLTQ